TTTDASCSRRSLCTATVRPSPLPTIFDVSPLIFTIREGPVWAVSLSRLRPTVLQSAIVFQESYDRSPEHPLYETTGLAWPRGPRPEDRPALRVGRQKGLSAGKREVWRPIG